MNTKPLVSVVIPVKNGERYLGEAISSVLEQHYEALEILVVDNGSTDRSMAVARSFGATVTVLTEPTPGAAHARNTGFNRAVGEYLAFLDADDLWLPGKLQRQLAELELRTELDMVFAFGENFYSPELTEEDRAAVRCDSRIGPMLLPSSMLARRASFTRIGPLPALREGEFIAWYGLAMAAGLQSTVVEELLLRRRVHLTNSTRLQSRKADLLLAAKMVLDRQRELQP
jgi:glycosyltransferase involved in cell wall biosynthesis